MDVRNPSGDTPRWQSVLQQWDCAGPYDWNIANQRFVVYDLH